MKLEFTKQGSGPVFIVLHGLFGSRNNWKHLARKWAERFEVYTVDLRNHGDAPHYDSMTYEEMADDVASIINEPVNILGHSMGGKVAMTIALKYPDLVKKLIVADIAPKKYPNHHQAYINAMKALDLSQFKSRLELDAALAPKIKRPVSGRNSSG